MTRFKTTLIVAALAAACGVVQAATLRVANQGDATSMDPHSLNESLQLSITGNVYEPLVGRDKKLGPAAALSTKWAQTSPTVWRFDLRRNTSFYLLGWTPGTCDAHNALSNLMATPSDNFMPFNWISVK